MRPTRIFACNLLVGLAAGGGMFAGRSPGAAISVVTSSNVTVRVMAANLTGDSQTYEANAIRIFQGLKPDVIAIQEFKYLNNTASDLRMMVNTAFGTNFSYYREPGYSLPNGIISRWPISAAGSWEDVDPGVNDRGFVWARIDLPGAENLYVVSVHLKASSGMTNEFRRNAQASQIKSLIQSNFPANAWLVVAGDCNIQSSSEDALTTFKSFLSDTPIPTDSPAGGDADTNNGRSERYDYVFSSPTFSANRIETSIGSRSFPNGLVFDSRVFSPLTDVVPVQASDSSSLQHMAVMKDFRVTFAVTNFAIIPRPQLRLASPSILNWDGLSNLAYTVESASTLTNWQVLGTSSSTSTNYSFTNHTPATNKGFYRVVYP